MYLCTYNHELLLKLRQFLSSKLLLFELSISKWLGDILSNDNSPNNVVFYPMGHFTTNQSHGLVIMGGYLCSEGRGFESRHHILHGHFSHLFVLKIVMFV